MTFGPKTYSHLLHRNRMPTEYELVTSKLLYYPEAGIEVNVPLQAWYQEYQKNSILQCSDWELFADPRETTYTKYTEIQKNKETFVDGILQSIEDRHYDRTLSEAWLKRLELILPVLRFPFHGLQMISAYIGQMAPGGKIVITSLMQTADEMRRIQRLAYRMRLFQLTQPTFGNSSLQIWQKDPLWQPLRKIIEELLITYDWGEAFVALNLCLKPLIDVLFMTDLTALASKNGDPLLGQMLYSLHEDGQWHQAWSQALMKTLIEDKPENKLAIQKWVGRWSSASIKTLAALAPLFDKSDSELKSQLQEFAQKYSKRLGIA